MMRTAKIAENSALDYPIKRSELAKTSNQAAPSLEL